MDKLIDIHASRKFPIALELGSYRNHMLNALVKCNACSVEHLVQLSSVSRPNAANGEAVDLKSLIDDLAITDKEQIISHIIYHEKESIPFEESSFDLVLSSVNMHWVNELPSLLKQIRHVLKPDGVFVGNLFGGSTLKVLKLRLYIVLMALPPRYLNDQELRYCFYLADLERRGGLSPHASPFTQASDVAALMQAAGFSLPTIDVDTVSVSGSYHHNLAMCQLKRSFSKQIGYPDAVTLMEHLWKMGEDSAALNRQYSVGKDTFLSMAALYQGAVLSFSPR